MNRSPFRYFLVWFLTLSVAASSLLLLISSSPSPFGAFRSTTQQRIPDNAFLEGIPASSAFPNTYSVTDAFAQNLADSIVANANPDDIASGAIDPASLASSEDINQFLSAYVASANTPGASIDKQRIKTKDEFSTRDIMEYLSQSADSFRAPFESQAFLDAAQKISTQQGDPLETIETLRSLYAQSESEIYALEVPKPLADFNASVIAFVNLHKTFFDRNDPLRSVLAIRNAATLLPAAQNAVTQQAEQLLEDLPTILSATTDANPDIVQAIREKILGIQTAYAVADVIGGPSNIISGILNGLGLSAKYAQYVQTILEWVYKILTEVLKDQLIHKLVTQVVNWANGGGEPQFVTNFGGFLEDSFNTAAGQLVEKVAPGLCKNFGSLVKIAVLPTNYKTAPDPSAGTQCTLTNIVDNVEDFYNSFENGSWVAYGAALEPNNNFFGSLIQVKDLAIIEGEKKKEAEKTDAESSSGYKSNKTCTNPLKNDLTGSPMTLEEAKSQWGDAVIKVENCDASGACTTIITCGDPNNPGVSAPDYQATTPGTVAAGAVNQAIGNSPIARIVNAQDITALVSALVNAGLNKLIQSGKEGLVSLTAKKLGEQGDIDDSCRGLEGDDLRACQEQNGDINQASDSSNKASKDSVISNLEDFLDEKGKLASILSDVIRKGEETLTNFQTASSTCSAIGSPATLDYIGKSLAATTSTVAGLKKISTKLSTELNGVLNPLFVYGKNSSGQPLSYKSLPDFISNANTPPTGVKERDAKDRNYFLQLSQDISMGNSPFGKTFGSPNDLAQQSGNVQITGASISNAGCGLLERSRLLLTAGVTRCSIEEVKKISDCRD